ncbi:integrase, catalytic region, zinc finger, CCHC-type containing protein [Tanacetum coccineum]
MSTLAEFMILSGGDNRPPMTKKYEELSATEKIQADCDLKATNMILQGLPSDVYSLVNHQKVAKDLWERIQLLMQAKGLKIYSIGINKDPPALVANHQMTPSHFNTYQSSYNNPQFQQQFSPSQSPQYGSIHPTQHYSTTYLSIPRAITYSLTLYPNAYSSIVHQDACLQPQSIPQIEYTVSIVNQQTHLAEFPQIDSGLAVPVFKQGDDLIDAINKMMSFLSTIIISHFPTTNNQLRNSSNLRQQATIHDGRVTIQPVYGRQSQQRAVKCFNCQEECHIARQCPKPKWKMDATWFMDKVLLVEAQGSSKVLN